METNKRTNVKMMAAAVGASAVVAAGALAMAVAQERHTPATVTGSSMTVGVTSTQETPPSAPATSFAVPVVKAKPAGS